MYGLFPEEKLNTIPEGISIKGISIVVGDPACHSLRWSKKEGYWVIESTVASVMYDSTCSLALGVAILMDLMKGTQWEDATSWTVHHNGYDWS